MDFLLAPGVVVAAVLTALAMILHTASAVMALYNPLLWADIREEHRWISAYGVHVADLLRPHNEHIPAIPRLFYLVDFFAFSATSKFLLAAIFVLVLATAGLLAYVAARWFFTSKRDALLYACLVTVGYVNGMQLTNMIVGFMICHWLENLFCLLFALVFALQMTATDSHGGLRRAAALVVLGLCAIFSTGSGLFCLATAVFLAIVFRAGWRNVAGMTALLVALAFLYFHCNPLAGHSTHYSIFRKAPGQALRFYFALLGAPGMRHDTWTADYQFCGFYGPLAVLHGLMVFALGALVCFLEWWEPQRRTVFSLLHTFVIVLVFSTGIALTAARFSLGVYEGMHGKYTCTVLLAWIAIFSLLLKQLSRYGGLSAPQRKAGWAAAIAIVLLSVLPAHLREIRCWQQANDPLWEIESALIAKTYDERLMRNVDAEHPELMYRIIQDEFRPRRWTIFARYPFDLGDPLESYYAVDRDYAGVGQLDPPGANSEGAIGDSVRATGWAWDERNNRAFDDILLTDQRGRIVGVAHTNRDRPDVAKSFSDDARVRSGWMGYARAGKSARLAAYGLIAGTKVVCPLSAP
jgi:hypothetical protein